MKAIVSTLFQAICFPHNGKSVAIEQLPFVGPDLNVNHPPSLNGHYVQVVSSPPQVNYVATCPMCSTLDEASYQLDPVVDMVISSIGILDHDLLTPIAALDMYFIQSVFFPFNKDLLEAMIEVCPLTCIPYRALSSWNS
jgi:hypothetical protein